MLSNEKRRDPSFINKMQSEQDPCINPEMLEEIVKKCRQMKLIVMETSAKKYKLKMAKVKCEKYLKEQKRKKCQILIGDFLGPVHR